MWSMPAAVRDPIGRALEEKFAFLLDKLAVRGTRAMAERWAPFVPGSFPSLGAGVAAGRAHEDVTGLSD
jgi:hypothetical protein